MRGRNDTLGNFKNAFRHQDIKSIIVRLKSLEERLAKNEDQRTDTAE